MTLVLSSRRQNQIFLLFFWLLWNGMETRSPLHEIYALLDENKEWFSQEPDVYVAVAKLLTTNATSRDT